MQLVALIPTPKSSLLHLLCLDERLHMLFGWETWVVGKGDLEENVGFLSQ